MALATLLNPQGISLLTLPFTTIGREAEQLWNNEWQSPNFHELRMQFFAWLLLLTFGVAGFSKKRLELVEFLLLGGFGYLGLIAARNIPLFALTAAIVLTRHGDNLINSFTENREIKIFQNTNKLLNWQVWLNWSIVLVLVFVVTIKIGYVVAPEINIRYIRENMPVDAVQFLLEAKPQGRIFNAYHWGGYLIWTIPEYPVFVDGRADLHGDEIIGQWMNVVQTKDGWQDILTDWEINIILLESNNPMSRILTNVGWSILYEDDIAVVYGR